MRESFLFMEIYERTFLFMEIYERGLSFYLWKFMRESFLFMEIYKRDYFIYRNLWERPFYLWKFYERPFYSWKFMRENFWISINKIVSLKIYEKKVSLMRDFLFIYGNLWERPFINLWKFMRETILFMEIYDKISINKIVYLMEISMNRKNSLIFK